VNWATLIEVLVSLGFVETLRQLAARIINRRQDNRRARLDDAQVIQGMSLKLLEPLEHQLQEANQRADELTKKLAVLESEFDALTAWARRALRLLDEHGLSIEPLPTRPR
jgi:F0F1-type ATP synthase membrane subunit b/b'